MADWNDFIEFLYWLMPWWAFIYTTAFAICLIIIWYESEFARGLRPGAREDCCEWRRASAAFFIAMAVVSVSVMGYHYQHHLSFAYFGPNSIFTPETDRFLQKSWKQTIWPPLYMLHIRTWKTAVTIAPAETARYFWWTNQWFSGYLAFVLALTVQSRMRLLRPHTTLAFAWIAMTSLSAAHCLLFAYILLTPPFANQKRFYLEGLYLSIPVILYYTWQLVWLPPFARTADFESHLYWCFAIPVVLSLSQLMPKQLSWPYGSITLYQAQKSVYFPMTVAASLLHLSSNLAIYMSTIPKRHTDRLNSLHAVGDWGFLKQVHLSIQDVIWALFDDPAIGAVGFDVILSLIALAVWTYVTSVSINGMVRSTLLPGIKTDQVPYLETHDGTGPLSYRAVADEYGRLRLREFSPDERAAAERRAESRRRRNAKSKWLPRWPEAEHEDDPKLHHCTALTLALGFVGGLGAATAGVYGAGTPLMD